MTIQNIFECLRDFICEANSAGVKNIEADISRILSSANPHEHLQVIEGIRSIIEDMEDDRLPYESLDYWYNELNEIEGRFPIVDHGLYLELLNAAQKSEDPHVQAAYLEFIKNKK